MSTTVKPLSSFALLNWMEERTRRATSSLVHQINGAPAVDVDEVEVAGALLPDDLRGGDEQLRFAPCDLHTEDGLRRVSSDERPFFFRALEEGHC